MEKELLTKMKKYLSIQHIVNALVFAGGFLTIVMLLILKPMLGTAPNKKVDAIIGYTLFIVILSFIIGVVKNFMLNKQIKTFKESGQLNRVLNDFQFAQDMYNGSIKLGKEYIFGKLCTSIVPYSDIARVYLCADHTNGVRTQRTLKAKLKNGKEVNLCCLKVYKNTIEDEKAIIEILLRRNPHIQIGYDKA